MFKYVFIVGGSCRTTDDITSSGTNANEILYWNLDDRSNVYVTAFGFVEPVESYLDLWNMPNNERNARRIVDDSR